MLLDNLKWTYAIGPVLSEEQKYTFSTWLVEKYRVGGMNVRLGVYCVGFSLYYVYYSHSHSAIQWMCCSLKQ